MQLIRMAVWLALAAGLQPALAADPDSPPVRIRITTSQFSLASDQVLSISHSTLPRHYRVCVNEGQGDMAVKVTSDGMVREVAPGDCWDFQAKQLGLTPARPLGGDDELLGHYERLRY